MITRLLALAGVLFVFAGCGGASNDPGLLAWMRVAGGTFVEGPMPKADGGPAVVALDLSSNTAHAGQIDKPLKGALDPAATAAAIGLRGDRGYWIVTAGLPDVQAPGYPTFTAALSFSPDLRSGTYDLVVRAADARGRLGAAETRELTITGTAHPDGALVISLGWDVEADLDLHVVDPDGVEIWKRNINSQVAPPPGSPVDPEAWKEGGLLDFDSNAACVIDGRRRENVVWKSDPPKGHYLVRVDTASLCGEAFARWEVEALLLGEMLGVAEGTSGPFEEAMKHDQGAGVLALEIDVP